MVAAIVTLAALCAALAAFVIWSCLRHYPKIHRAEIYQLAHAIYLAQNLREPTAVLRMKDKAAADLNEQERPGPAELYEKPSNVDQDLWNEALAQSEENGLPPLLNLQRREAALAQSGLEARI